MLFDGGPNSTSRYVDCKLTLLSQAFRINCKSTLYRRVLPMSTLGRLMRFMLTKLKCETISFLFNYSSFIVSLLTNAVHERYGHESDHSLERMT